MKRQTRWSSTSDAFQTARNLKFVRFECVKPNVNIHFAIHCNMCAPPILIRLLFCGPTHFRALQCSNEILCQRLAFWLKRQKLSYFTRRKILTRSASEQTSKRWKSHNLTTQNLQRTQFHRTPKTLSQMKREKFRTDFLFHSRNARAKRTHSISLYYMLYFRSDKFVHEVIKNFSRN